MKASFVVGAALATFMLAGCPVQPGHAGRSD